MYSVIFPNWTLIAGWYKDMIKIDEFLIIYCKLSIIDDYAFDIGPLRGIKQLIIMAIPNLTICDRGFYGMTKLEYVYIANITQLTVNYWFLRTISYQLKSFQIRACTKIPSMYNLIGGVEMCALENLHVIEMPGLQRITSNTITNVPILSILSLGNCGIESIELGSFDHLANTLNVLSLRFNKLKTMSYRTFLMLTDVIVSANIFDGNPWQCDCDLLMFQHLYKLNLNVCQEQAITEIQRNCSNSYTLVRSRHCLHHYGTNSLRVQLSGNLRLNLNCYYSNIIVRNNRRTLFYLIIVISNDQMQTIIACSMATARSASISLVKLLQSISHSLYLVCLFDASTEKRVWPRNCVSTILMNSHIDSWIKANQQWFILIVLVVVYLLVFVIAFLIAAYTISIRPIMLSGINNVILCRCSKCNSYTKAFVIPKQWTFVEKITWLRASNLEWKYQKTHNFIVIQN